MQSYGLEIKVRALEETSTLKITVNGRLVGSFVVADEIVTIKAGDVNFQEGLNEVSFETTGGLSFKGIELIGVR